MELLSRDFDFLISHQVIVKVSRRWIWASPPQWISCEVCLRALARLSCPDA